MSRWSPYGAIMNGNDLCKKFLEAGWWGVPCWVSFYSEQDALERKNCQFIIEFDKEFGHFMGDDVGQYEYVIPFNPKTAQPYTENDIQPT